MNVEQKAAEYAASRAVDCLSRAIEEAFKDGYREGYRDRDNEIPILENDDEYVDLGLPSGTLWSAEFVKNEEEKVMYYPYCEVDSLDIPTVEQWEELQNYCAWSLNEKKTIECIGPNGAVIRFPRTGIFGGGDWYNGSYIYFWLKSDKTTEAGSERENRRAAYWYGYRTKGFETKPLFAGLKIPIRLVRKSRV